jgi:uncharacterized protein (DUF1501 family)
MRSKRKTAGRLSRRNLIQVGSAGIAGLSLPTLLRADASSAPATAKSCIFIVLSGGPGQHETFDPKPDAPSEIRGQFGTIATRTPGVFFGEKMSRLAARTDRFSLIRSMSHADTVHVTAAHTMLTGQPDGSPADDSPMIGSLVSRFRPSQVNAPSHVWLHNMKTGTNKVPRYNNGLENLGQQYSALRIGHELDNPASPEFRVTEFDPPAGLTQADLTKRFQLLQGIDRQPAVPQTGRFSEYQQKALDLLTRSSARQAFDLDQEAATMKERYGRHPLGQYLLMSRRLIEAGVRLVTVTGWPGLAPGETEPTVTQVWDTHDSYYSGSDNMFGNGPYGMNWALRRLDQALAALLDDLQDRGLLQDTLVVAVGEFGRTPKFEGEGRGRGHWPNCYSALLAGGGTSPGLVYGSSDDHAAYVRSGRPVNHTDFAATVFHALGIPLDQRYGPDGFSFRVNNGQPLTEVFG